MNFKTITLTLALILSSLFLFSQDIETPSSTKISIEVDPATFGFGGYGFHLRIQPKNSKHLLLGIGTYAMDLPKVFVDMNENNKDQGWYSRINGAVGLFGEYHFSDVNRKWLAGTQISIQEYKIQKDYYEGSSKFRNGLLMVYGGYTWQPFDFNFYIKPWAGIGYTTKISGESNIAKADFDIAPILIFATLHLGYTF